MADEELTEFVCPNCNAPVQEDWAACPSCGMEFGPAEEAATPPAPPVEAPPAPEPPPKAAAARPNAPAAPPKASSTRAGRPAKPPRAPKAPRDAKKAGLFAKWPLIGPIAGRVGTIGVVGLGVLVMGLIGWFLVSNYDTMFAGQSMNSIGPNQANYVMMMYVAVAAGGGLTILGLIMARGFPSGAAPLGYEEMEGTAARAEVESSARAGSVTAEIPSRPPAREASPARAAPPAVAAAPPAAPAAPPARAAPPPVAAAPAMEEEEEDEEVGALELPAALPEPEPAAEAPSAQEAVSTSDELEDLFGELESEVQAAAEEEEVLYECPNCHGVVKEEDASCPHCQVVFEA